MLSFKKLREDRKLQVTKTYNKKKNLFNEQKTIAWKKMSAKRDTYTIYIYERV